jgi:nucleoside-diphosphate-sugar epimerase
MKSLLFTGASGFLGINTLPIIAKSYTVETLGMSKSDTYCVDLSKQIPKLNQAYDIVLHAAGKAHLVPKTRQEIESFYDVNLQGTINLCHALEKIGVPQSFIFVSSVAVYGCEEGVLITEDYPLNGTSPYAESKKEAEGYLEQWCLRNGVVLTILRPSLLAGINPPGNLGAMIDGIDKGRYLSIAGGRSRKSIAMACDIARVIPFCETRGGDYNLCDSSNPSFRQLERLIAVQLNKRPPHIIPYWLAFILACIGDLMGERAPINSAKLRKITSILTFSNRKIIEELGFYPLDVLENFVIKNDHVKVSQLK